MASSSTIANLIVKVGADISGLTSGLNKAQSAVSAIGTGMMRGGAVLTAGVTGPLVLMGKEAVSTAAKFETAMAAIQTIGHQTATELDALGNTFIDMSVNADITTESAQRLAEGFYFIQGSGFAGADALNILQTAARAATGGMTSTEVAANALVVALNSYGLSAGDAEHVSDVLFRTVDRGMITFEELASQIGDVTATGHIAGVSLEELGAAISTMTKQGVSGSETMTALNQVMLTYIRPTKKATDAAAAYGIELSANELRTKGLIGVLSELNAKVGGNAEAFGALFPNVRAFKGVLKLAGDDIGMFTEDLDAMNGAAGATANAFGIMAGTTEGSMATAANAMEAFKIIVGNELIPILTELLRDTIIPLLRAFIDLPAPVKEMIVKAAMLTAAVGPVLLVLGGLLQIVGNIGPAFGIAKAAVAAIGPILAALAGPAGPILLIVAALGLLVLAWTQNWGDIQGATKYAVAKIGEWLDTLGAWMAETWQSIKTGVVSAWNAIGDALYNAGRAVITRLAEGIRAAVGAVTGAVGWVVQKIRDLLPGSDAKEGPLSDLFASGRALPETFAKGILSGNGMVQGASMALAGMSIGGPSIGSRGPVPIGAGGGFGGGASTPESKLQNVSVNIYNPQAERSSLSTMRALRNLSALGVLLPSGA